MMFENFQKSFFRDAALSAKSTGNAVHFPIASYRYLLDRFGGTSFENGIYRVIIASDVEEWNARVTIAFPEFRKRVTCFGFDWLGRVFAVDATRFKGGEPGVVMLEPGTGEALEIPCNICTFHDEELIEYGDAALASEFYKRWLANGGSAPRYGQCVGYKKPLFLGGIDEISNLEMSDIDVYWHLVGPLVLKAKGLPSGTSIRVGH